jgi:Uma2 family endonuclease
MLATSETKSETLAELVQSLGRIPLTRIMAIPAPGTATEEDVLAALEATHKRLFELIDGVLVEKDMGARESLIGGLIFHQIRLYLDSHDLGIALPADGALRVFPGRVYIPDVSFVSYAQLPEGELPEAGIPDLFPDLAVEVISKGNTRGEIIRKRAGYFRAGTQLVWLIDHRKQIADVYTSPKDHTHLTLDMALDGGDLLPGLSIPLKSLFGRKGPRK